MQLPDQLGSVYDELLNMPYWIITSRPEDARRLRKECDALNGPLYNVEIMGITPENIKDYIKQFIDSSIEKKSTDEKGDAKEVAGIITFLNENPILQELGRIPVMLEMICSVWLDRNKSQPKKKQALSKLTTTTQLYEAMIFLLLKRCKRRGVPELIRTPSAEEAKKEHRELEKRYKEPLARLEELAFEAMKGKKAILNTEFINEFLEKSFSDCSNEEKEDVLDREWKKIHDIGLLRNKEDDGSEDLPKRDYDYYFIHLSFQEFFAARYLWRQLSDSKQVEDTLSWIALNKYEDAYQLSLNFLAGLLGASSSQEKSFLITKVIVIPILAYADKPTVGLYGFSSPTASTELLGAISSLFSYLYERFGKPY